MDIFAHSLSGVLLGQAAAPIEAKKKERVYYITLGLIALTFPDIDAISYLWGGPEAFATYHQRYTHTLFALIAFPPLIAGLIRIFHKDHSFLRNYMILVVGMFIHLAEDLIAHWPLEFFYPLSRKGWAFGLIREDFSIIVDFLFIIGAMLTFYDKLEKKRRIVALCTFGVVFLYLILGPGI